MMPTRSRAPAIESSLKGENYGAPGEIRTPDLLLRRTCRTNNQHFTTVCRS